MARHENPFDMQIKLLMIGDSGAYKLSDSIHACLTEHRSHH